LTILINLSTDEEVLKCLAEDDAFLETLLAKVTVRVSKERELSGDVFC